MSAPAVRYDWDRTSEDTENREAPLAQKQRFQWKPLCRKLAELPPGQVMAVSVPDGADRMSMSRCLRGVLAWSKYTSGYRWSIRLNEDGPAFMVRRTGVRAMPIPEPGEPPKTKSPAPLSSLWMLEGGRANPYAAEFIEASTAFFQAGTGNEKQSDADAMQALAKKYQSWEDAVKMADAVIDEWRRSNDKAAELPQYSLAELWDILLKALTSISIPK